MSPIRIGVTLFQRGRVILMRARRKGGFYHDGRFPTLLAVVQHYNRVFNLRLSDVEMNDLAEYLKSL